MTAQRSTHSPRYAAFLLFAALTLVVYFLFGQIFRPVEAQLKSAQAGDYSPAQLEEAVTPEQVLHWNKRITPFGNRFPGTPGHQETARFLKKFYEERGFHVDELVVPTTTPVVEKASLTVGETAIPITPFQPNLFQPDTTGADGISGRLVLFTEETLATEKTFSDAIAVVDAANLNERLHINAINYLRLGVRALIVVDTTGNPANWPAWSGMVTPQPINFPRVYADASILKHIGERARLDLQLRYRSLPLPTLIATRPNTDAPAQEAVVLSTHYDSYSLLPWHTAPALQTGLLAQHLAMVDGLRHYQGSRDLIIIASGAQFNNHSGEAAVVQLFGPNLERQQVGPLWQKELAEHTEKLAEAKAGLQAIATSAPSLPPSPSPFVGEQIRYEIETILYEKTLARFRAKARFEALPSADIKSEEYQAFSRINKELEKIRGYVGIPIPKLLRDFQSELEQINLPTALKARLEQLAHYHQERLTYYEKAVAYHAKASAYRNLFHLSSFLVPNDKETPSEAVTWLYGLQERAFEQQESQYGSTFRDINTMIAGNEEPTQFRAELPSKATEKRFTALAVPSVIWSEFNYPSATFIQTDRTTAYQQLTNPFHTVEDERWHTLSQSLRHASRFTLSLLQGTGSVRPPRRLNMSRWNVGGRVLVSGIGQSVLPSYPLAGAVLGNKEKNPQSYALGMGFYPNYLTQTDPYGQYRIPFKPVRFVPTSFYNLQAFDYDAHGLIRTAKDEGATAQKLFRSVDLPWGAPMSNVTIVTFPAAGVTLADLINPQTLAPYASVSFLRTQGLSALARINQFSTPEVNTVLMEPDTRFLIGFNAGSPENELVHRVRAFALGAPDPNQARDINGKGFIALEHPIFRDAYQQTAESMVRVNTTRATLQKERHMLDPVTDEYLQTSQTFLTESLSPTKGWLQRLLDTWDSITYSIIIHPLLRNNISQAITSVIWYLGLLVPFVFFFEKLVFGYSDIRYQLAAQVIIFLLSFGLLQFLHPAFGMIRSSVIILLGFGIFLICMAMTVLFASKASENLDLLRRKQSRVKAADVNTLGILATSFLLGLNNMHRRKVRTGLTCATLVLITFAMIAFTSIYDDFEEQQTVVGPASYQGLLIKKERFMGFGEGEVLALGTKYGDRYPVLVRRAIVGRSSFMRESIAPNLEITHTPTEADGFARRIQAKTVLTFSPADPLGRSIPLVAGQWLPPETNADALPNVLISDRMAERLNLSSANVTAGHARIELNGRQLNVIGLFNADQLDQMNDLDGRSLLPFDVEALQSFEIGPGFTILADESEARVSAANTIIASPSLGTRENGGTEGRIISVVVDLEKADYREARRIIRQYVEQSGLRAVYGLDGAASIAIRRRSASFEGLVDLIIPLFIAGITVLNTMKGSVYERKDELYVYNAVGIAPRYIFAMFFAESLVYAIVGSVLGYFLSQSVGATLTALDMTGGLNMTFASLNSVYASIAVMAAVFASTYFPAKTAVEIAATSDESGWKIPESDGERLEFDLPFLFDARERLAVLSFFRHFLLNHIEGDGGSFQASNPQAVLIEEKGTDPIPGIRAQIWLKPFDLGVSQELEILIPRDPQSHEFIARLCLTHQSGTRDAWTRLNRVFIATLRRQFLHWRAVGPKQKEELFSETRAWFEEQEATLSPANRP